MKTNHIFFFFCVLYISNYVNVSVFSRYICVCVSLQLVQGDDSYSGKLKYLFTNIVFIATSIYLFVCLVVCS